MEWWYQEGSNLISFSVSKILFYLSHTRMYMLHLCLFKILKMISTIFTWCLLFDLDLTVLLIVPNCSILHCIVRNCSEWTVPYSTILYWSSLLHYLTHVLTSTPSKLLSSSILQLFNAAIHSHQHHPHESSFAIPFSLLFSFFFLLSGNSCGVFRGRGEHSAALGGKENEAEQRLSAAIREETPADRILKTGDDTCWYRGDEKK